MTLPFSRAGRTFHILLVDDDPGIRFMLHATLDRHPALHVAAQASNGVDAVSLVERIRPDAAILGVQMPFMDGLTAAKLMKRVCPDTKIVIFSSATCPASVEKAFTAGADLFLSKTTPPSELAKVVERLCVDEAPSSSWSHSA
jgi:two-component system response regulator DesR